MADAHHVYRASTTAPVNIAVIKYWGKRDPKLNLPTNSSLSVTLSQSDLRTLTTASCSTLFNRDSLALNGSDADISGARTQACLRELRGLRARMEEQDPSLPKLSSMHLKLVSENNFPTAAGLASSAAGFAALVRAVANLYALPATPAELSRIARQGSGSACRSLFGGYTAWEMGTSPDGSDSVAHQVAPSSHWPQMRAIILVASSEKKAVGSTAGMQATATTSPLFKTRAEVLVPQRIKEMGRAIQERDFDAFAKLTMSDSNNFHACCLDTTPPIFYMNDTSRAAVRAVETINEHAGEAVAAYTFDAGPNAVVYYLEENEKSVAGAFRALLEDKEGWEGHRGKGVRFGDARILEPAVAKMLREGIGRVILTGVGEGPMRVESHLVDEKGEAVLGR